MKTKSLIMALGLVLFAKPVLAAHTESLVIGGHTYSVAGGDYVIGTDKALYKWMGQLPDGKMALEKVQTTGWYGVKEDPSRGMASEVMPTSLLVKDRAFIAEVEVKDCANFCEGYSVAPRVGSAPTASVDKVFSGGTLTVYTPTANAIGITTGHILQMTDSQIVEHHENLHLPMRGIASSALH